MYLVMELCAEGKLLEKESHLDQGKSADIIYKLLKALKHIHASGIIHRDIKPENIMFGVDGEPKLRDFEYSAFLDNGDLETAGTPYYIAPETLD